MILFGSIEAKVIKCYNCGGINRVVDEDSTCEYCDSCLISRHKDIG